MCTAVDFKAKDGSVIAGRTMEWFFDMAWQVVHVPQGSPLKMTAPPVRNLAPIETVSRYDIIGIAPGILTDITIIEGQNAAGLGMSGNFLPGFTTYQTVVPSDTHYVSILDFGVWALGQFDSVAALRAGLASTKIWYDPSLPSGPTSPDIHFVFNDRSGDGLVLEFVEGTARIYENKVHVLTNAPTYDWHLLNLRNYINLENSVNAQLVVQGVHLTALGSGGNTMALRADYSPPSRFARMAYLRWNMPQPDSARDAVQSAIHLLNNVDIPQGVAGEVVGNETAWDTTQWVVVKDLTHNQLYVADYDHRTHFVKIDLNNLVSNVGVKRVLVSELPYPEPVDVSAIFK